MENYHVYFKGVNFLSLIKKYFQEAPAVLQNTPITNSQAPDKEILVSQRPPISHSYEWKLPNGRTIIAYGYKAYTDKGDFSVVDGNKEYNCMYCLRKIKSSPLGIPILRDYFHYIDDNVDQDMLYYHMIDIFCCFNCLLAETKKRLNNPLYTMSLAYISELYTLITGKDFELLEPAQDNRLLKVFNGPMSWNDFHKDSTLYSNVPSFIYFIPTLEYNQR
jgi:hypothetical protein